MFASKLRISVEAWRRLKGRNGETQRNKHENKKFGETKKERNNARRNKGKKEDRKSL
jgi:hypothetical protein